MVGCEAESFNNLCDDVHISSLSFSQLAGLLSRKAVDFNSIILHLFSELRDYITAGTEGDAIAFTLLFFMVVLMAKFFHGAACSQRLLISCVKLQVFWYKFMFMWCI